MTIRKAVYRNSKHTVCSIQYTSHGIQQLHLHFVTYVLVLTRAAHYETSSEPFNTVTHRGKPNRFKVTVHVPVVLTESVRVSEGRRVRVREEGREGVRKGKREGG